MTKERVFVSILLIAFLAASAWIVFQGRERRLSVSGEALVTAVPDRARLTVGVEADGPTARAAQEAASRRLAAVLEALDGMGVPEKEIRTRAVSLEPRREYNPRDGREVRRGYRAANRIEITVTDLQKTGAVLDAAVAAGADTAGEIVFYLHDPAAIRAKALVEAVRDARRRASSLAAALDLRLGKAVSLSDEAASAPASREMMLQAEKAAFDAATPIEPGQITVQARVKVRFAAR